MKWTWLALFAWLSISVGIAGEPASAWPPMMQSMKPWTRWWWPASAVDQEGLSAQLSALSAAGFGGVEVTPIYGARGYENRYVEFLSPQWVGLLDYTAHEAAQLGLGVDMATGTGWPFGGPEVQSAQASSSIALIDGRLAGKPTAMLVKRAAPGGVGLVLDPYSTAALGSYLQRFTRALAELPRGAVRSQFHDSFEYYDASWTPQLPREFMRMNGYDIQRFAPQLMGAKALDDDTLSRVKGDYRRTLAKLHLDYLRGWVAWSHSHGFAARNQAHGAPGNLLDLYAIADIPETESYGMTALPIAGLREDAAGATVDPDPPWNLMGRFASSAGHVMGRPLISSESLTWLRENFREPPWAAKPQLDRLFAAGINHVFYHGVSYSPADAPWPGWFFYAATQFGPNNPLWKNFGAMNAYVARVQSVLQSGVPDNDILLYWPFDDLSDDAAGLMRQYGVHENAWLADSSTARMAQKLLAAGYAFDLVSDAQIALLEVDHGVLVAPGGHYRVIVVPAARRMSVETLTKLKELQAQGAALVFEALPGDVPGLRSLAARRAQLHELLADPALRGAAGPDLQKSLEKLKLRREGAAQAGLAFIRRAHDSGFDYFLANLGATPFDGWLPLGTSASNALLLDPLTGRAGVAATRRGGGGKGAVYLQLASGQSIIVRTQQSQRGIPPWGYIRQSGEPVALEGDWQLEFVEGGPTLPQPARMHDLASWTTLADPEAQRFAGTARYRIEFDAPPAAADVWSLDLGDVREAARVRLNGEFVAHAWSLPFRVRLDAALKPKGNVLEIEVSNLPANRIRDLDLRKVDWKVMKDINLASLRYKAFDASGWDLAPSGLLGPVRLVPLKVVSPR